MDNFPQFVFTLLQGCGYKWGHSGHVLSVITEDLEGFNNWDGAYILQLQSAFCVFLKADLVFFVRLSIFKLQKTLSYFLSFINM